MNSTPTYPFLVPGEWYDPDSAACALVLHLGIYRSAGTTFGPAKWVFWSNNPVGNAIYTLLDSLADAGVLEWDRDNDKIRLPIGYDPDKFGSTNQ